MIEAKKANYTVSRMCGLLEVSRSGFYKWRKSRVGGPSPSRQRRAELDAQVAGFHQASDGVYGAPRILADLRAAGQRVSRKTVAASLRRQGLAGICPRRFAPATTVVDLDAPVPTDLVRRRFDTGELDRVWSDPYTYLRTGQGWLCAVRDGCSRRVIGWAIDDHLHTELVESAVVMAVAMRGELAHEVILHADRGATHLRAAGTVRRAAQPGSLGRADRGVLGQRCSRILLGDIESRVLRPLPVANQNSRQTRHRRLDRTGLQPPPPLSNRYDQPGRLRRPIHSDGTSRLTLCLPNGVKPSAHGGGAGLCVLVSRYG